MQRFTWIIICLWIFSGRLDTCAWAVHEKTAEERIETLSTRIEELEKRLEEPGDRGGWLKTVTLSGLIEAEAGYAKFDPAAAGDSDEETSDVVLSSVELGIDAAFNPYIGGHLLFLWEEDDSEPVDLDEGFISLSGGNRYPVYANFGKFYLPFGYFESFFITDPLTVDLGETNESAVLVGWQNALFDFNAGAFNGDVDAAAEEDHIENVFASAALTVPVLPEVEMIASISYISSIADSDLLADEITAVNGPAERVDGISAYVSATFHERLFLIAEYVGALDTFEPGAFGFADGPVQPEAWNVELAWVSASDCGLGIKYEGAEDGGTLLAETRYGAVCFCQPFTRTYLGLEYLYEEFETGDENRAVTVQLAYQF